MLCLLDADICSYIIRRSHPAVVQRLHAAAPGDVAISVITRTELLYGVACRPQATRLKWLVNEFLDTVQSIGWEQEAADVHATVRAQLSLAGTPIGTFDTLLAAHALALNATVVTNNEKHFSQVPGLRIDNWTR